MAAARDSHWVQWKVAHLVVKTALKMADCWADAMVVKWDVWWAEPTVALPVETMAAQWVVD